MGWRFASPFRLSFFLPVLRQGNRLLQDDHWHDIAVGWQGRLVAGDDAPWDGRSLALRRRLLLPGLLSRHTRSAPTSPRLCPASRLLTGSSCRCQTSACQANYTRNRLTYQHSLIRYFRIHIRLYFGKFFQTVPLPTTWPAGLPALIVVEWWLLLG